MNISSEPLGDLSPAVSVVMPVRNGLSFLDQAVTSILAQTFADFEFVILDDASTDGTWERLVWWAAKDQRIRLDRSLEHLGPALSSQRVCTLARAPLLARQDADDVSLPERLQRQVDVFRSYPDSALVGTLFETTDAEGQVVRPRDRGRLLRPSLFNPFPHGSVMMSHRVFLQVGGYDDRCAFWEDQDLFIRMATLGRVLVLLESLYLFRIHLNSGRCEVSPEEFAKVCARSTRALVKRYENRHGPNNIESDSRVDCQAVYTALIHHFWLGRRPGMLSKLWALRVFPKNRQALSIWIFALLAEIHPLLLRSCVAQWVRLRDRLATKSLRGFDALELMYPWGAQPATGRQVRPHRPDLETS